MHEGSLEGGCVACPWHDYRFDAQTGRCETDPALRINTYQTTVENDVVHVEVGR